MVEFGNNLDPDEEFDVLHNILDFPMECLEEDEVAEDEDWDINNPQCLGPIPSNVLMGPLMMSNEILNLGPPNLFSRRSAPIAGVPELKQLTKHVDTSGLHIPPPRKFANVQESGSFRTQSPVSVLERSGSRPREKSLSIKSDNVIPVRSRSKRVRHAGINPWLMAAHGLSTSKQTPNARRSKESRKILFQQPVAMDLMKNSPRNFDNSLDVSDPTHLHNTSKPCPAIAKKCAHCRSTKTPQWRLGPLGPNTLCNACGVRYRSGRLFPEYRPAASPTFVPSQHSNSHKKVIEMRDKANGLTVIKIALLSPKMEAKIEEPPIAPQMEAKILELPSPQPEITRAPKGKQVAKHVDTSCSLIPIQIVGAPKQMWLAKHINASNSLNLPQIVGAPEQMRQAKHIDTSSSLIPSQIAGAPKRKHLAKYDDTCSSHIPLQNKFTKVQDSGPICSESHVSLLESSGSCLREKKRLSIISSRLKCIKPVGANLCLSASPSNARRGEESRKKSFQLPVDALKNSPKNASKPCPALINKCAHCQSTKTPLWREGPLGPRTLCNACGVRYRSGRLHPEYRPAASPTFTPSKHSNIHKEVVQMIKVEYTAPRPEVKTEVPLPSLQPEFVQ